MIQQNVSNQAIRDTRENLRYFRKLKEQHPEQFASFLELEASTLTAGGHFKNIEFHENQLIHQLKPPTDLIYSIGCNAKTMYSTVYHQVVLERFNKVVEPAISAADIYVRDQLQVANGPKKRGRKKKQIEPVKYFESQITFSIGYPSKFQIKVFRNGSFQVPGVRSPYLEDLMEPIRILQNYLKEWFPDIAVDYFRVDMRNYKTSLIHTDLRVNLKKMYDIIMLEKNDEQYTKVTEFYLRQIPDEVLRNKVRKLTSSSNPIRIAEVSINTGSCFRLSPKFYRPIVTKPDKTATIKILPRGKVNFDGLNTEEEAELIYLWLNRLYTKYRDQIIFNLNEIESHVKSVDFTESEEYPLIADMDIAFTGTHPALSNGQN